MPDDALAAALDELYGADPDAFLARRTELAKQSRAAGDAPAAKQIAALRKPTRSAFAINRLARTDPDAIERLLDLGERWRAAEKTVDADRIRELTRSRRQLIDELARTALAAVGEHNPSAAVRDEVVATLTAALSDETVADHVERGVLVKPARWEGFGFGGPELTLVPSASDEPMSAPPPTPEPSADRPHPDGPPGAPPKPVRQSPADRRVAREAQRQLQAERVAQAAREAAQAREATLAQARRAVDEAEDNLVLATDEEQTRVGRVHDLEQELADARHSVDQARREMRRAEIAHRRARDALRRLDQAES